MAGAQQLFGSAAGVVIAANATALPFPTFSQVTPESWRLVGAPPEFELEIWSNGTVDLTFTELFGGALQPLVVADAAITSIANASDTFTKVAHGLKSLDGPLQATTSGTLPIGLALLTDYWVIRTGADTLKLASSFALAVAGTPIDITTDGTGTLTLSDTSATSRVHWNSHGLLGNAGDGSISLTDVKSYVVASRHHTREIVLAISATLSDTIGVYVKAFPVMLQ